MIHNQNERLLPSSYLPSRTDRPLDTCHVYDSVEKKSCGHRLRLKAAILLDVCPICQSRIQLICDDGDEPKNVIRFLFGKQRYELSLQQPKPTWQWWSINRGRTPLAQQRIGCVLGLVDGWKILAKGKVMYPNSTLTPQLLSQQLVQHSMLMINKPFSLLVMGTRVGKELQESPRNIIHYVISAFWRFLWRVYYWIRPRPRDRWEE